MRTYGRSTVHRYGRSTGVLQIGVYEFTDTGILHFCYGHTNLHVRA